MSTRSYARDKRSPVPKNETVSRVMSANRPQNTSPEVSLRRALWKAGIRGYRLHNKKLPGRPDISFGAKKVAIFVHGCFWHRCPFCKYKLPKTNTEYWEKKFSRNMARDERHIKELRLAGWRVFVAWECVIKQNVDAVLVEIRRLLDENPLYATHAS
jgi:DNA mismatch endonuclease, patch repair protein